MIWVLLNISQMFWQRENIVHHAKGSLKRMEAVPACIVYVASYFVWAVGRFGMGSWMGELRAFIAINMALQTYTEQLQKALSQKIRTSNREDWYKTALDHRIQQHHVKIRNMKAPMKNLTFNLQRYIQCAEKRNEPVSFDFEQPGILYLNEANKTRDFLQNMLIYTQNYIVSQNTCQFTLKPCTPIRRFQR